MFYYGLICQQSVLEGYIGNTLWYLKLKLMGGAVSILPRADVDIYWLEFSKYVESGDKTHNG